MLLSYWREKLRCSFYQHIWSCGAQLFQFVGVSVELQSFVLRHKVAYVVGLVFFLINMTSNCKMSREHGRECKESNDFCFPVSRLFTSTVHLHVQCAHDICALCFFFLFLIHACYQWKVFLLFSSCLINVEISLPDFFFFWLWLVKANVTQLKVNTSTHLLPILKNNTRVCVASAVSLSPKSLLASD